MESKNQHQSKIIALSKIDKATNKALDKANAEATDKATNKPTDSIIEQQTNKQETKEQSIVRFDIFLDLYGKKVDTKKCKDKFCKLPEQTQQKILQVVPLYVKKTPDVKFRKLPLTWLNGECWNDDYSDVSIKPKERPNIHQYNNIQDYEQAIREWEAKNNTSPLHDIQGHLL